MSFEVVRDGMFSTILEVSAPPNEDLDVFKSFTKAKAVLAADLSQQINDLIDCKRQIRAMRLADVEKAAAADISIFRDPRRCGVCGGEPHFPTDHAYQSPKEGR